LGDWIARLLRQKNIDEKDFYEALEKGLRGSKCEQCVHLRGACGYYYQCRVEGKTLFFERKEAGERAEYEADRVRGD